MRFRFARLNFMFSAKSWCLLSLALSVAQGCRSVEGLMMCWIGLCMDEHGVNHHMCMDMEFLGDTSPSPKHQRVGLDGGVVGGEILGLGLGVKLWVWT